MRMMQARRLVIPLGVIAIATLLWSSGTVFADSASTDANHPSPLAGTSSGTVSAAGFVYYRFSYPGDRSSAQLTLTYGPTDNIRDPQLGFQVYAPDGSNVGQGSQSGAALGTKSLLFTSNQQGNFLLQLYDYAPTPITYQLTSQGLATPLAPTAPQPTPTVSIPTPVPPSGTVASGASNPLPFARAQNVTLSGSVGGSFDYYVLPATAGSNVSVTLSVTPDVQIFNKSAGFNIYQGGVLVASSTRSDATPWTGIASFSSPGGDLLVQVFNYDQARTIVYSLTSG